MTIPVRDRLLENVDQILPRDNLRWKMAPVDAEQPVKIVLQEEDEETTTGTSTPGSDRSSSRSNPPSPGIAARTRLSSKELLMKKHSIAEQALELPGQMVTLRNISPMYTEQMVLEELQDGGFQQPRDIDFFYMPVDSNTGMHLGCSFVNFVDNAVRNEFVSAFEGRSLRLAGPTAPELKVQNTSRMELEQLLSFGSPAARNQQEPLESNNLGCPLNAQASRKACFCPFCGNHVGCRFNFCSQCGSSLMQLR
jgi:hypothetical protein